MQFDVGIPVGDIARARSTVHAGTPVDLSPSLSLSP
jgi:hypothetical protein